MLQKKLKLTCESCGSEFYPTSNETICYLCQMQPDIKKDYRTVSEGCDSKVVPHLIGSKDHVVDEGILGQGFTGRRPKGAPVHVWKPRAKYHYKDKTCQKCKKIFTPSGALRKYCDKCNHVEKRNRTQHNNKDQRYKRTKEIHLLPGAIEKIIAMSKEYGLSNNTLVLESLKYFSKYYK